MSHRWHPAEHVRSLIYLVHWCVMATPVAIVIGSAVALFLWLLDGATNTRFAYPWLLYLLPPAGFVIGWVYHHYGRSAEAGNNLIIEQIHLPGGGVPKRMAPLILLATVWTHLFGGSAGREGSAVQMGGSIAAAAGRWARLKPENLRVLLMCGVAAGFGAVFGTPLAGAIFAIEVLTLGRLSYDAIVPCLVSAIVADFSCRYWGIHHTDYRTLTPTLMNVTRLSLPLLGKVALAAIAFGLSAVLFVQLTHALQRIFKWLCFYLPLRAFVGGAIVIVLSFLIGQDYLGLGVWSPRPHEVTIVTSFHDGGSHPLSWLWKTIFTSTTLASGFKGGEVTPLFYIGSTLGNTMARLLHGPIDLMAALGFVGVFAGATNTPLACTVMGIELFGPEYTIYFATACFISFLISGRSSIYTSQKLPAISP